MSLAAAYLHDVCVIARVEVADTPVRRMVGLLGRRGLGPGQALHIVPCGSVHTLFMRFTLDLAFLDGSGRVVKRVRGVPPWRVVFGGRGARSVLELGSGWLPEGILVPGQAVSFRPAPAGSGGVLPDVHAQGLP